MAETKSRKVLAVDVGFSDTKVVYLVDGVIKDYFKDITILRKMESDKDSELKYNGNEKNIFKVEDSYYMLGENALEMDDTADIISVDSYDDFKNISPILIQKYLKYYRDQVDVLVVTISAAFLNQSGEYKRYISDKVPFPIDNVLVVPQSTMCKVALDNIGLDIEDPLHRTSIPNYLGIDIGFNTIDVITVVNGVTIPTATKGYPGEGIVRIANKIKEFIKEKYSKEYSISRIKKIMYDGKFTSRSQTVSIQDQLSVEITEYIKWLHDFLEQNYGSRLDTISNVILFGGGAEVIRSQRNLWDTLYPKDFVKIPVTTDSATFYNAIGAAYAGYSK